MDSSQKSACNGTQFIKAILAVLVILAGRSNCGGMASETFQLKDWNYYIDIKILLNNGGTNWI